MEEKPEAFPISKYPEYGVKVINQLYLSYFNCAKRVNAIFAPEIRYYD
jgi:hypothetical protein